MAPGGEAECADAMGVDVPLGGMLAGEAHGLLRVFKVFEALGIVAFVRDAVLHENADDVDGVEPVADLGAFEVVGEDAVSSAGKDDDGGGCGRARGLVEGEGGLGDVGELRDGAAADEGIGGGEGVVFGTFDGGGFRGAVGPEREGELLGGARARGEECDGQEEAEEGHRLILREAGAT